MALGFTWLIPFYLNYIPGFCFSLSILSLTCTLVTHSVLMDICFTWNIGMFHVKHSSSCLFCSSLQLVFYLLNKELRNIPGFCFSLSILSLTCTLVMHSVLMDICFTWNIGMFHVKHSSSCLFCSSLQPIFYLLNKKLR